MIQDVDSMKLFCFPWSGGNSEFYFRYSGILGSDFEIIPISPLFDDETPFSEVIASLKKEILNMTEKDEKFILLGHSMGAVLAYETARALSMDSRICGVVISGMLPPSAEIFAKLDSELDREKAKKYSAELGMAMLSMLPDRYLDMITEKMNHDNLLLKRYESCCNEKFSMPSAVIYSGQEQEQGDISEWKPLFTGDTEYIMTNGNHFYLINDFSPVKNAVLDIRRKLSEI